VASSTRNERVEYRYLGGFALPFSTLYDQGTVGGTFALSMPPQLLGYKTNGPTLFSVHVVLDPPLLKPQPRRIEISPRSDSKDLLLFALRWQKELLSKDMFRSRNVQVCLSPSLLLDSPI
jgi:coiled-coil and C2 domain-containing protein 2A